MAEVQLLEQHASLLASPAAISLRAVVLLAVLQHLVLDACAFVQVVIVLTLLALVSMQIINSAMLNAAFDARSICIGKVESGLAFLALWLLVDAIHLQAVRD